MDSIWTEDQIQHYIDDKVEESLSLDYKAAGALAKTNGKKMEITKDVSAMANSDGGIIVYGVSEYDEPDKKYLPKELNPIDQTQFSKEWLEQIVNNIRPRISGVVIHPIRLKTSLTDVVYIVEIPKSTTAHQATDKRYYRRFNFQAVPMEDYEIRDVMNRATMPEVSVEFGQYRGVFESEPIKTEMHPKLIEYRGLRIIIKNEGTQVINRFKVILVMNNIGWHEDDDFHNDELVEFKWIKDDKSLTYTFRGSGDESVDMMIVYQPNEVLFPKEEMDIGSKIKWAYRGDIPSEDGYELNDESAWREYARQKQWTISWILYADNMPCKSGIVQVSDLPYLFDHWS